MFSNMLEKIFRLEDYKQKHKVEFIANGVIQCLSVD